MAWDESNPSGSRDINLGDNDIRQMKEDVRVFLSEEHVAITDFSSALTGYHKFPAGASGDRPTVNANARRIFFNTTKMQIEFENLQSTIPAGAPAWFTGGAPIFAAGTVMLFFQAAAPTGWTQVVTQNDKIMRVVSGAGGGSGGTTALTSAFAASNTGGETGHTHTGAAYDGFDAAAGSAATVVNTSTSRVSGVANSDHTHSTPAYAPQYVDILVASKD